MKINDENAKKMIFYFNVNETAKQQDVCRRKQGERETNDITFLK